MFSQKHRLQHLCRKRIRLIRAKNKATDQAIRALNRWQPNYDTVHYWTAKTFVYRQKIIKVECEIRKITNREGEVYEIHRLRL